MTKESDIAKAKAVADAIRLLHPDKAAEIDRAILEAQSGQRESLKINVGVKYRLEKYDGDYDPAKQPVDIIEGEG
jgi:uncharacterized membrane protein (UPF0127 family)